MELELSEIIIDEQIDLGSLELDVLKIQPTLIKKEIVENGNYSASDDNVDGYSEIDVNVNIPKIQENITKQYKQNGKYIVVADENYDAIKKVEVDVNIPIPKLGTKKITTNGTYKAIDDDLGGYSEVEVACGKYAPRIISFSGYKGTELNYELANLDTSNLNSTRAMFSNCSYLTDLDLSNFNTSSVTVMDHMFNSCSRLVNLNLSSFITNNLTSSQYMFAYCPALKSLDLSSFYTNKLHNVDSMFYGCTNLVYLDLSNFDTSKVNNFRSMFYRCLKIVVIPKLNASSSTYINNFAYSCESLTDFGGLENLGQAYSTTQSANYSSYKLDLSTCTALTEQSLLNVLNNLYDIKTKGCKAQQVVLGSTNLAKLTSTEGQQALSNAQAKGWTLS